MKFIFKNKGENPMKYLLNTGVAIITLTSSLALSGCNLYAPTSISENKVQVQSEVFTRDALLVEVNDTFIAELARNYTKHGGGTLDLVITYDPKSYRNTAMTATNKIADIAGSLRDYGVRNINAGIMPIKSQGDEAHLLISYNSFTASAPKGCDSLLPGMENGSTSEYNKDYKLGCSIETMLARQVAKPSHLLGRGATGEPTDGRAASNIVDFYRMGAPNESLEGESATDD